MMPIPNNESDRADCVPAMKDESFLPSIKPFSTTKSEKGRSSSYHGNNTARNNNNNNKDNKEYTDCNGMSSHDAHTASVKPYSSAPASEANTPFKLPTIDRSESKSVSSLVCDRHGQRRMARSRDSRKSRLCRSPSCPSLAYWADTPESPRSTRLHDTNHHSDHNNIMEGQVRSYFTHRDEDGIKLPNIFNKTVNSSFALTNSTANSSTHTSRDTSPFQFKREDTFLTISHREHVTADGPVAYAHSPQHTYADGDAMSRSSTQTSALLLPISSSCHDPRNAGKSKRKRKKQTGLLVTSDVGSEAEKLLREKLGAIERRDFEHASPPRHRDGEKTDLSDTAFIDKVQDETTLANGAPEPLATKPPVYQNTPARIKTEKNVAPVKA